jgi:hypothetical protein
MMSGQKTWEMRSRDTLVRGRIALIRKGSKSIIGIADLVRTLPKLSPSELKAGVGNHRVPESAIGKDFKHSTAWVLQHARPLRDPVPYRHPAGAVIWVNLDPEVAAMVDIPKDRSRSAPAQPAERLRLQRRAELIRKLLAPRTRRQRHPFRHPTGVAPKVHARSFVPAFLDPIPACITPSQGGR